MLVLICGLTGLAVWLGKGGISFAPPEDGDGYPTVEQSSHTLGALPQAATGSGVTVTISPQTEETLTYTQVYEKNQQSIVTIYVMDEEGMGQGAGIVLTQDGYIITNAHVVQDAQEAVVVLSNDISYPASLVGSSESEDLAVLKIEAQGLIPAEFGDSNLLRVGDSVSALGNPLGYSLTLTPGIVSALDRQVNVDGNTMYLLQTSAPINFGNSGGALLNDRGQVVGVTTVKIVTQDGSAEALGFAIPTERVKYVVDQLIAGEEIRTPVLGITAVDDPAVDGLVVREIQPWSDAGDKGLQVGDVIVGANGNRVSVFRDLQRVKDLQKVGDELLLQVERDGQILEISVRLADQAEHE
jgi:S1-C subfamily serine protease